MSEYHKIQTIFKRDTTGKIIEGQYSLPEFEYLSKNEWLFTEKVDGTNIRVIFKDGKVTFNGKTDNAQIPASLVTRLYDLFTPLLPKMQEIFPDGGIIYGEGYGAKIQKGGGNYKATQDFVMFDVNVGGWWLRYPDLLDVANKLGIEVVPIIGKGTLADAVEAAKIGITSHWGNFQAEGIVARPEIELRCRNGDRVITKIKCRDFQP